MRASFPRLCLGKLDLSNSSLSRKTLSIAKPPRGESSFAAFRMVLDEKEAPGKGIRNPSGFRPITVP